MTSSDREFYSTSARAIRYLLAPGPSGTPDIYATFSTASLGTIVQGVALENVNATTPYDLVAVNSGAASSTTTVASVTVSDAGMVAGDICLAHFACAYGNNDGLDFDNTGFTSNTILTQATTGESTTWVRSVWVLREATGTSCQLQINCNQTTSHDLNWDAYAFRLVPA